MCSSTHVPPSCCKTACRSGTWLACSAPAEAVIRKDLRTPRGRAFAPLPSFWSRAADDRKKVGVSGAVSGAVQTNNSAN